jgi:hypothetical protein
MRTSSQGVPKVRDDLGVFSELVVKNGACVLQGSQIDCSRYLACSGGHASSTWTRRTSEFETRMPGHVRHDRAQPTGKSSITASQLQDSENIQGKSGL